MKKEEDTRSSPDRIQMQYIKLRYKENTYKKKEQHGIRGQRKEVFCNES